MQNYFFKNVSISGSLLALAAAAVFCFVKPWVWAAGVLTGALWVFLNSFFLFQLLDMGLHPRPHSKDKILIYSMLKFPVLYVAGFFILRSRIFPVMSLLAGLTAFFAAFAAVWMKTQFSPKTMEKSA